MDRRSFLKSSTAAVSTFAAGPMVLLPSSANAFFETAMMAVSFGSSVAGFLGSNRAAKAAAAAQAAQVKMLEGLVESMDEVLRTQAMILERVSNLPIVFREILTAEEYRINRLNILSIHRDFLNAKADMLMNTRAAESREAVDRYADRIASEVRVARRVSTKLHITEGAKYSVENVLLRAICARVEVDLCSELLALGRDDAFSWRALNEHLTWFRDTLDRDDANSIISRAQQARSELYAAEFDVFGEMWTAEKERTLFAQTETVIYDHYNDDGTPVLEPWEDDDGQMYFVRASTSSPIFQYHRINRIPLTSTYGTLDMTLEPQKYASHGGGRYEDFARAIVGKGYLQVPEEVREDAANRTYNGYFRYSRPNFRTEFIEQGLRMTILEQAVEVAEDIVSLCNRALIISRSI